MYLLGSYLPDQKLVRIALTTFYGISHQTAKRLCARLQLHELATVSSLNETQVTALSAYLSSPSSIPARKSETTSPFPSITQSTPSSSKASTYSELPPSQQSSPETDPLRSLVLESDLRRELHANLSHHRTIGSYVGRRHVAGLPVRGQKTRTNAITAKKLNRIERRGMATFASSSSSSSSTTTTATHSKNVSELVRPLLQKHQPSPYYNMAASGSIQTPLTQEYPAIASMSRQEIESLLAGWNPSKSDPPWYLQQASQPFSSSSSNMTNSVQSSAPIMPNEEAGFEAFIESQPQIQQIRQESKKLLKESEEKAARNMKMQPGLENLRNETQHLYDRARNFEQEWPQLENQMKEAYKRFSPQTLLFALTQSASKLHDQSESLASAFAEGLPLEVASAANPHGLTPPESGTATPTGRDADGDATFVRRYRALRTTYHRRNLMADRWARGTITWRDD